jgi:hypothetical protein
VATNAVASLAVTDRERAAKFLEAVWPAEIRYPIGLLHCEFRIWPPK